MVDIQRDKRVTCFPSVLNGSLEFNADFVVKDLEVKVVAMVG